MEKDIHRDLLDQSRTGELAGSDYGVLDRDITLVAAVPYGCNHVRVSLKRLTSHNPPS